ncbi:hypothetical protein C8J56DRAFT_952362 [Mycena floridula]|nr:hypothetical protein C8J56DRAFT_952362 [Mycena floridula]
MTSSFHPSYAPAKTSLTVSALPNVIQVESGVVERCIPKNLKPVLTTDASVIRTEIQHMISLNEPCCKTYNIKEEDYETICETTTQAHTAIRIHYNDNFNFILTFMPGAVHEVATLTLRDSIQTALANLGLSPQKYLRSYGSTSVILNHPNKGQKMPDASWRKLKAKAPCVVLEVGFSETASQLRSDMAWWFTREEVQLVILMDIIAPSQDSVDKKPIITIEQWINVPDSQARHPSPQLYKTCKLADAIRNDEKMEIPLWAFLDAPLPGGLERSISHLILDTEDLQGILNDITDTWDEELGQ